MVVLFVSVMDRGHVQGVPCLHSDYCRHQLPVDLQVKKTDESMQRVSAKKTKHFFAFLSSFSCIFPTFLRLFCSIF